MSLVMFLNGPHSTRHKDCPQMSYCGFSKVYNKSFSFSVQCFGEKAGVVLRDSRSKKVGVN